MSVEEGELGWSGELGHGFLTRPTNLTRLTRPKAIHKEKTVKRTYELVYIVRPDASEQQVADLHTQVEQIVGRMGGTLELSSRVGQGTAVRVLLPQTAPTGSKLQPRA